MFSAEYRYLRPLKAASLKQMYATPYERREELEVWRGEKATVFPLREFPGDGTLFGRAGVLNSDGKYVELSGMDGKIFGSYPLKSTEYRDETVVYCGYLVNHWGHYLIEGIARLWYCLENDPTVDKYVFVLDENENREVAGNHRELLQLLNIWDKVEIINRPITYKEVIVPEPGTRVLRYCSPKFVRMLDTIAENVVPDPSWVPKEKIFFTRSNFAKDNGYEFGLESMDNFFSVNGFEVLAPEKIPLSQTIFYIRNATEIASISGSTPHNMLFAKDGQNLIMMERLVMNDDCQLNVNLIRQLHVTHVDANYHLYPVDWCGPYIVGYNDILQRFIDDRHMLPPDPCYTSKKYLDKCMRQYLFSYRDNYQYRWFMSDWYSCITDTIWEAYKDSYPYFEPYLLRKKPFLKEQYFQFHYWKQFIKWLIRYDK